MKNEPLDITYSYWDGSGHRRRITVRKGDTISDFLRAVRDQVLSRDPRGHDAAASFWHRVQMPLLPLVQRLHHLL